MRKSVLAALAVLLFCATPARCSQMTLTAEKLDYDMDSGHGTAAGKVTLVREGLTVTSDRAEAWSKEKKVHLWSNVKGSGVQDGTPFTFSAEDATADFSVPGNGYHMKGNVLLQRGQQYLDAGEADVREGKFWAKQVARLADEKQKTELKCDAVNGQYDDGGVLSAEAKGNAYLRHKDEKDVLTEIWGDVMTYDRTKDIVTVTGNARAVQQDRTLKANRLLYSISSGKLTAVGGTQIVVDVPEQTQKKPAQPAQPAKPAKPAQGKKKVKR